MLEYVAMIISVVVIAALFFIGLFIMFLGLVIGHVGVTRCLVMLVYFSLVVRCAEM